MSFTGRVDRESHKGGLLVSFDGKAPRLGAVIRIVGGRILGKVETVLGPVDLPLLHIHPLKESIDSRATIGSPVEIAPRDRTPKKKRRFPRDNSHDKKKKGGGGNRGRGQNRSFRSSNRKSPSSGNSRTAGRSSKSGYRGGNRNPKKSRYSGDRRGSGKRRGGGKRR